MWSDFVAWLGSAAVVAVLRDVVLPAVAILVAGLLAAWIARQALRSTVARLDRDAVAAAVAAAVAEVASAGTARQPDADRRAERDVRLRLLPLPGAVLAAEWVAAAVAALQTADPEAPSVTAVRDRLLAWVAHPRRAQALFGPARRSRVAPERPAPASPAAVSAEPQASPTTAPSAAVDEAESGPLTEPLLLRREPDPALLAAVERELSVGEVHARHARPAEDAAEAERPADHVPAHRDRPVWAGEEDDSEVVADAQDDTPEPVLVSSLTDRRFSADTLVPDGATPSPRASHRTTRRSAESTRP